MLHFQSSKWQIKSDCSALFIQFCVKCSFVHSSYKRCLIQSVICIVSVVLRWVHGRSCSGQRAGNVRCEICRGTGEETRQRQTVVHAADVLHIDRARHTPSPHHCISFRNWTPVPVELENNIAEQFKFSLIFLLDKFQLLKLGCKNGSLLHFHNEGWGRNSLSPFGRRVENDHEKSNYVFGT